MYNLCIKVILLRLIWIRCLQEIWRFYWNSKVDILPSKQRKTATSTLKSTFMPKSYYNTVYIDTIFLSVLLYYKKTWAFFRNFFRGLNSAGWLIALEASAKTVFSSVECILVFSLFAKIDLFQWQVFAFCKRINEKKIRPLTVFVKKSFIRNWNIRI